MNFPNNFSMVVVVLLLLFSFVVFFYVVGCWKRKDKDMEPVMYIHPLTLHTEYIIHFLTIFEYIFTYIHILYLMCYRKKAYKFTYPLQRAGYTYMRGSGKYHGFIVICL